MVDDGTNCSPRMTFCLYPRKPDVIKVTHPNINDSVVVSGWDKEYRV
jgi:hypothetical protein